MNLEGPGSSTLWWSDGIDFCYGHIMTAKIVVTGTADQELTEDKELCKHVACIISLNIYCGPKKNIYCGPMGSGATVLHLTGTGVESQRGEETGGE